MKRFFIGLSGLLLCNSLSAQQIVTTAGHVANGSSVHLSYSVGEPVVATLTSTIVLTQGFQQVNNSSTGLNSPIFRGLVGYPNPTTETLTLRLPETQGVETYRLHLLSPQGQPVIIENISQSQATLSLGLLPAGVYTLHVEQLSDGATATLQVLKLHR